ncbi:MAG: hypothetical protein KAR32_03280, partial [Candidatus Omnitrophica bacterium]|nr:hypothetical protein [Candidatus Omnitrophota bacterium]
MSEIIGPEGETEQVTDGVDGIPEEQKRPLSAVLKDVTVSKNRVIDFSGEKKKRYVSLVGGGGEGTPPKEPDENKTKVDAKNIKTTGDGKTVYQLQTGTLQYILGGRGLVSTHTMEGAQFNNGNEVVDRKKEGYLLRAGNAVYLTDGTNETITLIKKNGGIGIDSAKVLAISFYGLSKAFEGADAEAAATLMTRKGGSFLVEGDTINGETVTSLLDLEGVGGSAFVAMLKKGKSTKLLAPRLAENAEDLVSLGIAEGTAKLLKMGSGNYHKREGAGPGEKSEIIYDDAVLKGDQVVFVSDNKKSDLLVPNDLGVVRVDTRDKKKEGNKEQGSSQTKGELAGLDSKMFRLKGHFESKASQFGVTHLLQTPGSEHSFAARSAENPLGLHAGHPLVAGSDIGEFEDGALVKGDKKYYSERNELYPESGTATIKFTKQGIDYGDGQWIVFGKEGMNEIDARIQGKYDGFVNESLALAKKSRLNVHSADVQKAAREYALKKVLEIYNVSGDDAVKGRLTATAEGTKKPVKKGGIFVLEWLEEPKISGFLKTPRADGQQGMNIAEISGMMDADAGWTYTFAKSEEDGINNKITQPDTDAGSKSKDAADSQEGKRYNFSGKGEQKFAYSDGKLNGRKVSVINLDGEEETYNLVSLGVGRDLTASLMPTAGFGGTMRTTKVLVADSEGNVQERDVLISIPKDKNGKIVMTLLQSKSVLEASTSIEEDGKVGLLNKGVGKTGDAAVAVKNVVKKAAVDASVNIDKSTEAWNRSMKTISEADPFGQQAFTEWMVGKLTA